MPTPSSTHIVRGLHKAIDDEPDVAPILLPLQERAERILRDLEDRRTSGLAAMDLLAALAAEKDAAMTSADMSGLSWRAFAIAWKFREDKLTIHNYQFYAASQYLGLQRVDTRTGQAQDIRPGDPRGHISPRRNFDVWSRGLPWSCEILRLRSLVPVRERAGVRTTDKRSRTRRAQSHLTLDDTKP